MFFWPIIILNFNWKVSEKMKTLVLSGSPRKNGDSNAIVKQLCSNLSGEVIQVNAYDTSIRPCIDCRYCLKNEGCSIQDNMQEIYQLLEEVDNIIISSPLYFSELTGELLSLASRLQTYYAAKFIRHTGTIKKEKKGILILTGGGSHGGHEKAVDTAKMIFALTNAKMTDTIFSLNTDKTPSNLDTEALAKANEVAKKLNQ